jgi:hypothetical protein
MKAAAALTLAVAMAGALGACVAPEKPAVPLHSANPDHAPTQTEPGLHVSGSATLGVKKRF